MARKKAKAKKKAKPKRAACSSLKRAAKKAKEKAGKKAKKKAAKKAAKKPKARAEKKAAEEKAGRKVQQIETAPGKAMPASEETVRATEKVEPIAREDRVGAALVVGGGIGGIQAALDLADSGIKVYLVDRKPSIGGVMSQLDKTFPTNDCSLCILSPKMVEAGRHRNIELLMYSELKGLEGAPGRFRARVLHHARRIDLAKCTGCGECAEVCPVVRPDEYNECLSTRKAVFRLYPQAVPAAFMIDKERTSRCKLACPAGTPAQGYIALAGAGRYEEAYNVLREAHPFPAVCGRVCHHPCEDACARAHIDAPVAVRAIKRFVADRAAVEGWASRPYEKIEREGANRGKVAVVGAGPAGLTAALALARQGHGVTVIEALPEPGGMLRTAIPPYRLPRDVLQSEIEAIAATGVDIRTNCALGREVSFDELRRDHDAVLLTCGCRLGLEMRIPGEDMEGVVDAIAFLRESMLGDGGPHVPGRVGVVGGGNAAIDAARTALRLGADEVTIYYRRSRAEMPAYDWEVQEALDEGVKIEFLTAPVEAKGSGGGLESARMVRMELGEPDSSGRRRPVPIQGSEFDVGLDMLITAIGQKADLEFGSGSDALKATRWGTVEADPFTLATSVEGVFAAGDAVGGAATVVEAIGAGKRAAVSMDNLIQGRPLDEGQAPVPEPLPELKPEDVYPADVMTRRAEEEVVPAGERRADFREIVASLTEEQVSAEAARCLSCGPCSDCGLCEIACKADAILRGQVESEQEIEVGSVILSPGFDEFDAKLKPEYGYGRYPNVYTSIEFERLSNASGPYGGHLKRRSDLAAPRRIAFIQCVGSRDSACDRDYCSSVCCMYAVKESVIAKEHAPDLEITIFGMDIRSYGKDFDRFVDRAQEEYGIRMVRSRIPAVEENPETHDLRLRYETEDGSVAAEEFDMVVLSVGLDKVNGAEDLARAAGIELDGYGFCRTSGFSPVETTRPGVYVCGAFSGPKDIPETVAQASAAASKVSADLSAVRDTRTKELTYPPEVPVAEDDEPRVGVFICHCGINIGGVVDVPSAVEYARTLPNVVYAEDNLYTCSQDTQVAIREKIREHDLNRVVVAACTPRTHEPLFQETCQQAGLNRYLFEMANIRDQCSWVHMKEPERATDKAKDLVRMTVAKARKLRPLARMKVDVDQSALVIGGGPAGMTAAVELAGQGFDVTLVERENELGGRLRRITGLLSGESPTEGLAKLIERVKTHDRIEVVTGAGVTDVKGYVGNFEVLLNVRGEKRTLKRGAVVVATGASERRPTEYGYGESESVITQSELEKRLAEGEVKAKSVVMIQCVGSRDDEHPYCSRVCCTTAVKNALRIKKASPETQVYILYRDMRTYGLRETAYGEAREAGVIFVRFDKERPPEVSVRGERPTVRFLEPLLGETLEIGPDLLVLSAGVAPNETNPDLAKLLKVPVNADGFFLEAHVKLRPVDFATDGIFVCGTAHAPKHVDESIAQACAAASRACTLLAAGSIETEGVVAEVDRELCSKCGICESNCPYAAIERDPEEPYDGCARVTEVLCKGCGVCAANCPERAIRIRHYRNEQIIEQVHAALAGVGA